MSVVPFTSNQPAPSIGATMTNYAVQQLMNPGDRARAEADAKATVEVTQEGVTALKIQNGFQHDKLLRRQAKTRKKHVEGCAHCRAAGFDTANCMVALKIEMSQRHFLDSL